MNEFNLLLSSAAHADVKCDICVIGAGAAGIYLSARLASKGIDVILVEAGDSNCRDAEAVGFMPDFSDHLYSGATKGRAFGLGGTTATWGGLLIPHLQHDLPAPGSADFDTWSHILSIVSEETEIVLSVLGCEGLDFDGFAEERLEFVYDLLKQTGFATFVGLHLPFRHKNFVYLLKNNKIERGRLRLWLNAVADSWDIVPDGSLSSHIRSVNAVARNGNRLNITANHYIITAGTIESTRLLLEIRESYPNSVMRSTSALGCYLADHLSMNIADVSEPWLVKTSQLFGPRFTRGCMRGFRFIDLEIPSDAPKAFAHFIFQNDYAAFNLAKEVLLAVQARHLPKITVREISSCISDVIALAYNRFIHNALYIPAGTKAQFQLDVEQTPDQNNRIFLGSEKDMYNRRRAVIQWRVTDVDMKRIEEAAEHIIKKWSSEKKGLPELIPRNIDYQAEKPYDAYHPVGTCRMGSDLEAVVDLNLRVRGVGNLWVASTGVLPRVGLANPTFTLLCLSEALTEQFMTQ